MPGQREFTEAEIRDMDKKTFRKEVPSGWMEVSRYETLALLIDALLESPPNREYTVAELAAHSGASERSIRNRISSLVRLGIIDELENREPQRYSLNPKNPITQNLYELNSTVERVKEGSLPEALNSRPVQSFVEEDSNRWDDTAGQTDRYEPNQIAAVA